MENVASSTLYIYIGYSGTIELLSIIVSTVYLYCSN